MYSGYLSSGRKNRKKKKEKHKGVPESENLGAMLSVEDPQFVGEVQLIFSTLYSSM